MLQKSVWRPVPAAVALSYCAALSGQKRTITRNPTARYGWGGMIQNGFNGAVRLGQHDTKHVQGWGGYSLNPRFVATDGRRRAWPGGPKGGQGAGIYSTRSRGAHNVSLCAPLQGTGLGRADPQKGPKGGRLQPLFRGTVPAKIYHGRKPSDSTAPASRDPSAFLWPVARSQGRPRLPAGLPGGWGRVGGGFGVRRVLGHSGGNTGHYDGSPFLWGVICLRPPPKGTSAPPADSSPYADLSGIQTLYAAAPGAACKVSFPFSKVRPQNGPGGGWKRLPPGQRIGPGLTGWAFL